MPDSSPIQHMIQPDGSLEEHDILWVDWSNFDDTVTLDGDFTAAELRAIADHMDSHE